MFERFTERSRRVMGKARQEAQRLNGEFISPEHIFLGIIKEGGGFAAEVLKNLPVEVQTIRQGIERLITSSTPSEVPFGQIPFSPRAKHVLELAEEAADQWRHDVIGTEHLLLGILEDKENVALQVLLDLGINPDDVRRMVREAMREGHVPPSPDPVRNPPFSDLTKAVLTYAKAEAEKMGSSVTGPGHLLLIILDLGGPIAHLLAERGVTRAEVEALLRN